MIGTSISDSFALTVVFQNFRFLVQITEAIFANITIIFDRARRTAKVSMTDLVG